eukprot:2474730-Pleurochrysis_carterae.AAC.1
MLTEAAHGSGRSSLWPATQAAPFPSSRVRKRLHHAPHRAVEHAGRRRQHWTPCYFAWSVRSTSHPPPPLARMRRHAATRALTLARRRRTRARHVCCLRVAGGRRL